nr:unnamed protein product [Callosobruchus chinensis]
MWEPMVGKVTVVYFQNLIYSSIWKQDLSLFHNQDRYPEVPGRYLTLSLVTKDTL